MADSTSPSETTLNLSVERAIKLLGAVSNNPNIYAALAARGYDAATHERGWELLHGVTGFRRPLGISGTAQGRKAADEIDAWDEPNFDIAHAALDFEFPIQSEFLFEDLTPATGVGSLVSVTTFLDRRDALKSGKDRDDTKAQDQAAIAKLAARGIDDAKCAELRGLLALAQAPAKEPPKPSAAPANRDPVEIQKAKLALHGWTAEWRSIANRVVTRRDYLFQLGLAERKVKAKGEKKGDAKKEDEAKKGDDEK